MAISTDGIAIWQDLYDYVFAEHLSEFPLFKYSNYSFVDKPNYIAAFNDPNPAAGKTPEKCIKFGEVYSPSGKFGIINRMPLNSELSVKGVKYSLIAPISADIRQISDHDNLKFINSGKALNLSGAKLTIKVEITPTTISGLFNWAGSSLVNTTITSTTNLTFTVAGATGSTNATYSTDYSPFSGSIFLWGSHYALKTTYTIENVPGPSTSGSIKDIYFGTAANASKRMTYTSNTSTGKRNYSITITESTSTVSPYNAKNNLLAFAAGSRVVNFYLSGL